MPSSPSDLDLLVRAVAQSESALVVKAWKYDLHERREPAIREKDWWALCNYVLNRLAVEAEMVVGCHPSEPQTPLCWMALRRLPGLSTYETLYLGCRRGLPAKDPALAASMERALVSAVQADRVIVADRRPLNLFQELRR